MKKLLLMFCSALLFTACGGTGGGGTSLNIKSDGQTMTLTAKTSGVDLGNVISTSPGKPNLQTSNHSIIISNYDMDLTNLGTMRKPLTAADQIRLAISITGEAATNEKTPFKVGTYLVSNEYVNDVRDVSVTTFADGKEKKIDFDTMSSFSKLTGQVKITSVTDDSVSGTIDVTEGDKSVKGSFTAKLTKK
ncbi:hypothetical protein BH10ACI2_BH10ACI2_00680 [soil metagenome]